MANGNQQNVQLNNDPTNILGQLVASQIKEVEKLGRKQVEEAVQQGVPLENIAGQLQKTVESPAVGLQPPGQVNPNAAGQPQQH